MLLVLEGLPGMCYLIWPPNWTLTEVIKSNLLMVHKFYFLCIHYLHHPWLKSPLKKIYQRGEEGKLLMGVTQSIVSTLKTLLCSQSQ